MSGVGGWGCAAGCKNSAFHNKYLINYYIIIYYEQHTLLRYAIPVFLAQAQPTLLTRFLKSRPHNMEIVTLLRNQIFYFSRVKDYDRNIFPGEGCYQGIATLRHHYQPILDVIEAEKDRFCY